MKPNRQKRLIHTSHEITISPVQAISDQVAIFPLGGAGNSDHMISKNNTILSYVIRREQRLALKHLSMTT